MTDSRSPGQLLGAIFSASPDAIVVVDDAGRIVLSSPAITDLFGYYPEELVGESVDVLLPNDRRADHARHLDHYFTAPRARQMGDGLDLAGRHRDGTEFAVEVSLAPVNVGGAKYAAAFVRDGRERRRAIDRVNAVNEISQRLLAGDDPGRILPLVAQSARRLTQSEAVWIVTADPDNLVISSVDGPGTEILLGVNLSAETSRSAEVMRTGTSEVIKDLSVATNVPAELAALDLGPGLYVPLIADDRRLGTLVLGRSTGRPQFEPLDVAFAELFANSMAAAIENGEVRAELERLGIASEHERIAFDLHDTVIQELFGIGMSLQAARSTITGRGVERVDSAVEGLDNVIREIRNTIFRIPSSGGTKGVREETLRIIDKFVDELGFTPRVAFHGSVEVLVPELVVAHLLQVFTEALSNIARHAHASSVELIIAVEPGWLSFTCVDDGIGLDGQPSAGNGTQNMKARASNLGGRCELANRSPSGTVLSWSVPI